MPIYEYESEQDGEVISLLRPMSDADATVEDPSGRGRTFRRRQSVFGVSTGTTAMPPAGGRCPCGVDSDRCGRMN